MNGGSRILLRAAKDELISASCALDAAGQKSGTAWRHVEVAIGLMREALAAEDIGTADTQRPEALR